MYFNHAMVYQITRDIGLNEPYAAERLAAQLSDFAFTPCNSQDLSKCGWAPPLHSMDKLDMVLAGDGRILFTLKIEEKILPGAAVTKQLATKVKEIEAAEQRKLGRKEKDALKDNIIQELLPRAFTKERYLNAYISIQHNLIIVDTSTASQAEYLLALLRKTLGSLPVVPIQSKEPAEDTLTSWLRGTPPDGFTLGNDAVLADLSTGKATFKNQDLTDEEVLAHIEAGKHVDSLRLIWGQTFSLTLTSGLLFKSIKWADEFKASNDDLGTEDLAARYDADFALMGGELEKMLLQSFELLKVQRQED